MSILDVSEEDIQRLSAQELQQLVFYLAEAEVEAKGGSPTYVHPPGTMTAADDGIDIYVDIPRDEFDPGFIPRASTIFQCKKHGVPPSKIIKEMMKNGKLNPLIHQQADNSGSYVIVSLESCNAKMTKRRKNKMTELVQSHPKKDKIHLDFYGSSILYQWLSHHPSVMYRIKGMLKNKIYGWRGYGRWSSVQESNNDQLIIDSGISFQIPGRGNIVKIEEAINATRNIIHKSEKAVRIIGLSGVGKTRFVQSLFENDIGEFSLSKNAVIYADAGEEPTPHPLHQVEECIILGKPITVVIDNCDESLHVKLTDKIKQSEARSYVKLITIEYDIREYKSAGTEVIEISADGPETAAKLIRRNYDNITDADAIRIAELTGGNAKLALIVSERVQDQGSLSSWSDNSFFDRLFKQRNESDKDIREHAEILSLVYSFIIKPEEEDVDEINVLGKLCSSTRSQIARSAGILQRRKLSQVRGKYQAILPQAIAVWLAKFALENTDQQNLLTIMEDTDNRHLLSEFVRRLELMEDNERAQEIIVRWISDGGILNPIFEYSETKEEVLQRVAPAAPSQLLYQIEKEVSDLNFDGLSNLPESYKNVIFNVLAALAYDSGSFKKCIDIFLEIYKHEDSSKRYISFKGRLLSFFQPFYSGTHAPPEQKHQIIRDLIWSDDKNKMDLGFEMLLNAFELSQWTTVRTITFGAKSRDDGYEPRGKEIEQWYNLFIDLIIESSTDKDSYRMNQGRDILANKIRELWDFISIRNKLVDAFKKINQHSPWPEGWKAIHRLIYFDYPQKDKISSIEDYPGLSHLVSLQDDISPKNITDKIMAYLYGDPHDIWILDPDFNNNDEDKYHKSQLRLRTKLKKLGKEYMNSEFQISYLGNKLFESESTDLGVAFGKGLAQGSKNLDQTWKELVSFFKKTNKYNISVLIGFIAETKEVDSIFTNSALDNCMNDPILRPNLMQLHPQNGFSENDLDRCLSALDYSDVIATRSHGDLFTEPAFLHLPESKLLYLAEKLMQKRNGPAVLIESLSRKIRANSETICPLNVDLRKTGLVASINLFNDSSKSGDQMIGYYIHSVIEACLCNSGNVNEKKLWLKSILSWVDNEGSYHDAFYDAIKVTIEVMPEEFLDCMIAGNEQQIKKRMYFFRWREPRKSMLEDVNIDQVIKWCRSKKESCVWEIVASIIPVYAGKSGKSNTKLSDISIELLNSCPAPEKIIKIYSEQISPKFWSGNSRVKIMQNNLNAFKVFENHKNSLVVTAMEEIVKNAEEEIQSEQNYENRIAEAIANERDDEDDKF